MPMCLLTKMPDDKIISLGDMVDQGPASKAVIDWFMSNGQAVIGNHEHMMLNHCRKSGYYENRIWELSSVRHVIMLKWINNCSIKAFMLI